MAVNIRYGVMCLAVIAGLSGCRTADNRKTTEPQPGAEVAGLGQAAVIVATLPLLPVASAYHAVSGDIEKDHERTRALHRQFDPIYEQRIAAILARNPVRDAGEAFRAGARALLPHRPDAPIIHTSAGCSDLANRTENLAVIRSNELLNHIRELVDTEPLDHGESRWNSDTYRRFLDVAAAYRVVFNDEMLRLSGSNSALVRSADSTPVRYTSP